MARTSAIQRRLARATLGIFLGSGLMLGSFVGAANAQDARLVPVATTPDDVTGGVQGPATANAASRMLIVVIQATLAQRGCSTVAVNGQWDNSTQGAARGLLAGMEGVDLTSISPSAQLLEMIRGSNANDCLGAPAGAPEGVTAVRHVPDEKAPAAKAGAAGGKSAAAPAVRKKRATSKAKTVYRKRASTRTAAASAPKRAAARSAGSASRATSRGQASGPPAFVRPVGVGAF